MITEDTYVDSVLHGVKKFSTLSDWVMTCLLWNIKGVSVRNLCWEMTWFLRFAWKYSREKRKNRDK